MLHPPASAELCLGAPSNFQALRTTRYTPAIGPDAAVHGAIASPQSVEQSPCVAMSHTNVSPIFSTVQALRTQRRLPAIEPGTGSVCLIRKFRKILLQVSGGILRGPQNETGHPQSSASCFLTLSSPVCRLRPFLAKP